MTCPSCKHPVEENNLGFHPACYLLWLAELTQQLHTRRVPVTEKANALAAQAVAAA